jgi:endo-1,4-beta-xylanase
MAPVTRRTAMAGALASLVAPAPGRGSTSASPLPLRDQAAVKGILYGSCVQVLEIEAKDDFTALIIAECGCVVPETAMNWNVGMRGRRPGVEDFSGADGIIDFSTKNNLAVRGHSLLWYQGAPEWFRAIPDRAGAEAAMVRFIAEMCTRYKGRVFCWDVVNEPIDVQDGRPDNLRRAVFLDQMGPEYFDLAHHVARATDPTVSLVVNDYGIEYDTPSQNKKRDAVLRLLERMKKMGTPVDALGVQAHLRVGGFPLSQPKLRRFFADVAALGLDIHITELDVTDEQTPPLIMVRDQLVADEYERFLDVALDQSAVNVVVTWGLSDRHSWINGEEDDRHVRPTDGQPYRPLPFDATLARKPAWSALARAFQRAQPRKSAVPFLPARQSAP